MTQPFEPGWRVDVLLLGEPDEVLRAARTLKRALRLKGDVKLPAPLAYELEPYGTGVWLPSLFEAPAQRRVGFESSSWPHRPAFTRLLARFAHQHPRVILAGLVRINPSHPGYSPAKAAQIWVSGLPLGAPCIQDLSLQGVSGFLQTGEPVCNVNWVVLWRAALVRDELMGAALAVTRLSDRWPGVCPKLALPSPPAAQSFAPEEEEALALPGERR